MSNALTVQIKDVDGTVAIDMSSENGWDVSAFDGHGVNWVRETVSSRYVDGEFDVNKRKGAAKLSVVVRASGSSLAAVDGMVEDLITAVSDWQWLITRTLEGVSTTWRCRAADVDVSFSVDDWLTNSRILTLSIPAQPNPTIEGAS